MWYNCPSGVVAVIDLETVSGMPLALDESGRLVMKPGAVAVEPVPRTVAELRRVLAAPGQAPDGVAYLMYRGVAPLGFAADLAARNVRFDVTVLFPGTLGREYVKTAGHYHPAAADCVAYPEVYEVLSGRAAFMLQRAGADGIEDAVLIEAGPGDKVNMLPGYGHVTINTGEQPLVINNIVAADFDSVYGDYVSRRGAAYYLLKTPAGPVSERNANYPQTAPLRVSQPMLDARIGLTGEPLFTVWRRHPEVFAWLDKPSLLPPGMRP